MRFPALLAIVFVLVASDAAAQVPPTGVPAGPGRISGVVTGPEGQPLQSVGISLRAAADSALVTGAMTDPGGRFRLDGLLRPGAYIAKNDAHHEVSSFKEAINWLLESGRKGQTIQRYKGLGEMNPEQLWDTTINPQTRRLIQVRIEDALAANDIFATLMGDQVEPRREFIEKNALAVANLDV